jgi:chemotaxis methyl-accepting protein methylase
MSHVYTLPNSISFRGKGLFGYSFGPLKQKDVEVLFIESEKGHDTFMVCKGVTRIYYVLAGNGYFTINGREYRVQAGVLVEAPAGVEYTYSGSMTLLAFCKRRRFGRKDVFTRWNSDVVGKDAPWPLRTTSWLTRLVRLRILGKSPTNAFLRLNQRFWNLLPSSCAAFRPFDWYAQFLHALARRHYIRAQAFNTFFLRNRPELELIRRLVATRKHSDTVRVAVLGCSTGAEVYSIAWTIKKARPDIKLMLHAVDISGEAVEFAKRGRYPLNAKVDEKKIRDFMAAGRWLLGRPGSELVGAEIFDRMTDAERAEFFDAHGDVAAVKNWIKDGINWRVADVRTLDLLDAIGLQDIVVASNFLCHMESTEADQCLRNIARLVGPRGCLFVTGIDLDVRETVARELGWEPITDLLEEIHDGDPCLRDLWPCEYASLEPLNKRRRDWKLRYATAFQVLGTKVSPVQSENELAALI